MFQKLFWTKIIIYYMLQDPVPSNKKGKFITSWRQICAYFFQKTLNIFYKAKKKTHLESIEDIEYLRFLEHGENQMC